MTPARVEYHAEHPDFARENELVAREIQEIRDALEAFKAAVEAGEVTGFEDGGLISRPVRAAGHELPLS